MPVGFTRNLLTGMAEQLQTAGVGVWNPAGVYALSDTGIMIRANPDKPDRMIALASYVVDDIRGMADITIGVQIKVRGLPRDPFDCDDLADGVYDALHALSGVTWQGVPIVDCYRVSHTSLGSDGKDRWLRSENYYVDAMRPNGNNTD